MKNPYMPFWVADYIRGVKRLSLEAKGLYVDIILELWVVGEMKNDVDEIAETLGLNKQLTRRVFKLISHKFQTKDGLLSHSRVTKERLKLVLKSEKAQKSANIRWGNDANVKRGDMQTQCYTESDTDSNTDNINTQNDVLKNQSQKEVKIDVMEVQRVLNKFSKEIRFTPTNPKNIFFIEDTFKSGFSEKDLEIAIENFIKRQEIEGNLKKYWVGVEKFFNIDHINFCLSDSYLEESPEDKESTDRKEQLLDIQRKKLGAKNG